jgi:hypothetical protein
LPGLKGTEPALEAPARFRVRLVAASTVGAAAIAAPTAPARAAAAAATPTAAVGAGATAASAGCSTVFPRLGLIDRQGPSTTVTT